MLVTSFNKQLEANQLYWPKRFKQWQCQCFPIERVQQQTQREMLHSLYQATSNLLAR